MLKIMNKKPQLSSLLQYRQKMESLIIGKFCVHGKCWLITSPTINQHNRFNSLQQRTEQAQEQQEPGGVMLLPDKQPLVKAASQ